MSKKARDAMSMAIRSNPNEIERRSKSFLGENNPAKKEENRLYFDGIGS